MAGATDQVLGITGETAVKEPCRVATTANITLSGVQSIDTIDVVADDRVLVKDQTSSIENGIWIAGAGAWTRALDFNDNRDVRNGTQVLVMEGATPLTTYTVTTANPVYPGTSDILFQTFGASGGSSETPNSIKTKYESNADTNPFTNAAKNKNDLLTVTNPINLDAIAPETAESVKTKYESNDDTNEFTDAEKTKLAGLGTPATSEYYETSVSPPNDIGPAINAALATQSSIKIPAGDYGLSVPIDMRANVPIYGIPGATKLTAISNNMNMVQYLSTTFIPQPLTFQDIILNVGAATGVTGINFDGGSSALRVSRVRVKGIDLEGLFDVAMDLRFCANTTVEDVFSISSTTGFRIDNCADTIFDRCRAQNGTGRGFDIIGGVGAFDEGIQLNSCSTNGQGIGVHGVNQDFCHIDSCSFTTCPDGALRATGCLNWTSTNTKYNSALPAGEDYGLGIDVPISPAALVSTGSDRFSTSNDSYFGSTFGLVYAASGATINGSQFYGNNNTDIQLSDGTTSTVVSSNRADSTGVGFSIVEAGASSGNNKIEGNHTNGLIATVNAATTAATTDNTIY